MCNKNKKKKTVFKEKRRSLLIQITQTPKYTQLIHNHHTCIHHNCNHQPHTNTIHLDTRENLIHNQYTTQLPITNFHKKKTKKTHKPSHNYLNNNIKFIHYILCRKILSRARAEPRGPRPTDTCLAP